MTDPRILELTAEIVSAHVGHNAVASTEVAPLIQSVYEALQRTSAEPAAAEAPQEPAVSVRASVKPDYIICLEDGAKLKMLKRYLRTHFDMSPEEYRAKWNLPRDYPMVAPNYAETRKRLALKIGLGRKAAESPASEPKAAKASRSSEPSKSLASEDKPVEPTTEARTS
jgi:predicted transcriptional regulator